MPNDINTEIRQNLIPNEPTLNDLLDLLKKDIFLNLTSHHLGTIQTFNQENQTASVTINYKRTYFQFDPLTGGYEPQLVNYPTLIDCPVIFLGGGQSSLTFPIAQGDECLVLFNDRDIDNWFQGGAGAPNATARLHSFSDGLILVGLRSLNHVLSNFDATRAVLKNDTAMVGVGPSLIKIANEVQSLKSILEGLTAKIDQVLTTGSVMSAPGPVSFTGSVASFNPTIEELLE